MSLTNPASGVAPIETARPSIAAAMWWLVDTAGAILFAASLAWLLGDWRAAMPGIVPLGGIVLSGALRAVAQAGAADAGQRQASGFKDALRGRLVAALLPTGLARGTLAGEDLRTAIDAVEACEGLVARFRPLRLAAVLSPLMIAAAVALASWVSALVLLATLVPFGIGMAFAGMAGKAEAERQFQALSRLSGLFVDRVAALPAILSFGAEARIVRQIGDAAQEVAGRTMQVLRVAFVSSAVLEFFAAISVALVAVYCGFSLLGLLPFPAPERLTLTRAFFALAMAPEFYLGMRRLAAAYHDRQQGDAALAEIAGALGRAEPLAAAAPHVTVSAAPALRVHALVAGYPDGSRIGPLTADWRGPALHALTGRTGAGKSSLLHALIGLTPETDGAVLLDDVPVAPASLRAVVGWAGQRPLLLPGTLEENLIAGAGTGEDLPSLLDACGLGPLVARRGLALAIDPRGSGLSGGERRRLGLVRAIASGRPIVLLDEPTADLDPDSAGRVRDLLARVACERLVIAATHDPLLAARCASVVRLP